MQQEPPQPPVVYMHVLQAAHADGQLCMVEALVHTTLVKYCVVVLIMVMLMELV
jgi:hypothetical protein